MQFRRPLIYSCLVLLALIAINLLKLPADQIEGLSVIKPNAQPILTPRKYQRALESSLLSYPEWYLVYSPEEYANYTQHHVASQFPFFKATWQYWDAYQKANQAVKPLGKNNRQDQIMLMVIGGSTSVEYFLRGLYEKTIGTLTASISGRVEEDDYAAKVATNYVQFIKKKPWYAFDFYGAFKGLWQNTHFFGPGFLRKLERKYILSTEYLIKAVYGGLIGALTHASYGVASTKTAVLVTNFSANHNPGINVLKRYPSGETLITVPRLAAFANYANLLAKDGVQFKEIAGNNSFIALSVVVANDWHNPCGQCAVLFKQMILTQAKLTRVILAVPVSTLTQALHLYRLNNIKIEHIYDY